jgi:hypothetical protein
VTQGPAPHHPAHGSPPRLSPKRTITSRALFKTQHLDLTSPPMAIGRVQHWMGTDTGTEGGPTPSSAAHNTGGPNGPAGAANVGLAGQGADPTSAEPPVVLEIKERGFGAMARENGSAVSQGAGGPGERSGAPVRCLHHPTLDLPACSPRLAGRVGQTLTRAYSSWGGRP